MIEIRDLSFAYGKKTVFSDLCASFRSGSFYGIVGPNGCGKTTLIRLLCGLARPTSGEILLDQRPYSGFDRSALARQISLLPQSRALPAVTVEELVSRGRYPYLGLTRRMTETDRNAVAKALTDAGVQELAHRDVTTLSGGERQRVCFALLLAQDTPYVLLDEPTTYLDVSHRFVLMDQLKSLKEQGKCVIAVLHDLSLALRYCDALAVLNNGSLRAFDTPEALISSGVLEDVFGVRCLPVEAEGETDVMFLPTIEK